MPTTLEQLQTSLNALRDAKDKVVNDMSDICDISLLDDGNDITFSNYVKLLIHISNAIDSVNKCIERIEKTVTNDKPSSDEKSIKIIFE